MLTVKGLDLWELTSFPKQKPYTPEMFQEGTECIDQHERDKKSSRDNTPRQDIQFERTNQTKHKPSRAITSIKKSKQRCSAQKNKAQPPKLHQTTNQDSMRSARGPTRQDHDEPLPYPKNSREKWRKWISLTGSPCWPSASANHRQTG